MASGTFVSLTGFIDSNHHHGGGAMSAPSVAVFDKTLQTTNMRHDDLMAEQGPDRQLVCGERRAFIDARARCGKCATDCRQKSRRSGRIRIATLSPHREGGRSRNHVVSETTLTGTFDVH